MASSSSQLRPSGAGAWTLCPGSVAAQEGLPNPSSPAAREGTRAHQLLSHCLTHGIAPSAVLSANDEDEAAEYWEPDEEMVGHVQDALDYVHGIGGTVYSEIEVDSSIMLGLPEKTVFGTADVVILHPGNTTIEVLDLKYGAGVFVDHLNNTQLAIYGAGALQAFNAYEFNEVKLTIFQPRHHAQKEPRSELLSIEEFNDRIQELAPKAQLALTADAPRVPGESQCRWCRAKGDCPERIGKVTEIVETVFKPIHAQVSSGANVTAEQLAEFKDSIPLIKNMISDIEEEIYKRISAGVRIPGYKLGKGKKGARKWLDAEAAQKKLQRFKVNGKVLGLPGAAPRTVISPAATDKLKLSDKQKKILSGLWEQKEGKACVVPDSDPRPSVDIASGFEAVETQGSPGPMSEQPAITSSTPPPSFL